MDKYSQYAKEEMANEPTPQWKLGAVKKAVKFVVNNKSLIPSKKVRGWVSKYGGKMIDALDFVETGTKVGLQLAFEEASIPKNVAKALADFIVTFIL
ncbi:MAG TPA: hypothetical protein VK136_08740 [Bacillota bacterium]|nr:hypothetical protein [Bacillota bacterium]